MGVALHQRGIGTERLREAVTIGFKRNKEGLDVLIPLDGKRAEKLLC